MQTTINHLNYLLTVDKLRYFLGKVACWGLIWAQYLLIAGLLGTPATANTFAVMLLAEALTFFALREIISTNIGRDFMDLAFYGFLYWLVLAGIYFIDADWYRDVGAVRTPLARFFFLVSCLRLFWAFKVPNSETYFAWPIIGPVSGFFAKYSDEPVVRSRSQTLLVYSLILLAIIYAKFGFWPQHTATIKEALGGLLGFYLFFKFFRPFMKGNIALMEENIQYRTSEEKLASLIMTVQTQAGGKLNPELIKTMCHFAQLDDRTQLILAATIADVAKSIVLPANQSTYDDDAVPPKVE